ncbi:MAG: hypothetical protein WCA20_38215 [Candidatus Sulfotelmatobacter sp.]
MIIAPYGAQVFGQSGGKSVRVTYRTIFGSMRLYLALQFFRDLWEYIISEIAQEMVHDLIYLLRRNCSGTLLS